MKCLYPAYAQSCLDSSAPDLSSVNLKVALLTDDYTYSAAHNAYDDLTGVIASTGNLGSKTITGGVLDAADTNFGSPGAGDPGERMVLYYDSGTPSTSPLIAYTDEDAGGSPLSITPDGTLISLAFDASGLFSLV